MGGREGTEVGVLREAVNKGFYHGEQLSHYFGATHECVCVCGNWCFVPSTTLDSPSV